MPGVLAGSYVRAGLHVLREIYFRDFVDNKTKDTDVRAAPDVRAVPDVRAGSHVQLEINNLLMDFIMY